MAQRFGAVFAIAIGSAVFSANGSLRTSATAHDGFNAAIWACVAFAVLAAVAATAVAATRRIPTTDDQAAIASTAAA